ncbi:hypothetical protein SAICODRAFT_211377 [Saitoella complicata NRRL Y-17804]|uniref:uncharacterized protein n=1 Tax=Saitoella complicata (strain BCRC 22490 / CBS 7301 / JCM 7358 / NBRC 10748 / NRRL Y-17804) TaxID=698492 RepID=UPI000866A2A0|nr:uncharacterized protein SAICODRAFT_211377 [Saitoella complicata NRRL Y-17804]ODQ54486.1 hypothetical protein SAICODRAFT_211377 [Saitoella complicata NRRL Y-17804]
MRTWEKGRTKTANLGSETGGRTGRKTRDLGGSEGSRTERGQEGDSSSLHLEYRIDGNSQRTAGSKGLKYPHRYNYPSRPRRDLRDLIGVVCDIVDAFNRVRWFRLLFRLAWGRSTLTTQKGNTRYEEGNSV